MRILPRSNAVDEALGLFSFLVREDPRDIVSLKQAGGVCFSIKCLGEARMWQKKALETDPHDSYAMAYLNLVYRLKASLDRDDAAARGEDLKQAREWTEKAMSTRKAKEEKRLRQAAPTETPAQP